MSRPIFALAVVALLAPLARGQDKDWKWDPLKQPKAKDAVGDRFFAETDESEKQHVLVTVDKKVAKKTDEEKATSYRFTGETLKVENDKATESKYKIEKWSFAKGEEAKDTSLEGKTIVVKGTKKDATWECLDKDAELSDDAKKWIEKELAKKSKGEKDDDDDKNKLFMPEKAISDGDTWTRDPGPIVKGLFGESFEVDAEKSSFKGKLSNVHVEDGVHYGHVAFTLSLKVKSSEQWSEGGTIEIAFATDGSLEEFKRQSAGEKMTLAIKLEGKKQTDKGALNVKLRVENEGNRKHGPLKEEKK